MESGAERCSPWLGGLAAGLLTFGAATALRSQEPGSDAARAPTRAPAHVESDAPAPEGAPESPGPAPAQTQPQTSQTAEAPQTAPQTRPKSKREMMLEYMRSQGIEPPGPSTRYEKGIFMIRGSMEIEPRMYDAAPLVQSWIEQIEPLWKARLPLAAKMGNLGRVTFKGVIYREGGVQKLEKIEPSGLESLDEAASQAMEEFRPSFKLPPDYPLNWGVFYLKFLYNIFDER